MVSNKIKEIEIGQSVSDVIYGLRFPLMVMVVFIHAKLGGGFEFIQYGISDIICRIAVPLFYIISGYLFFIKADFSFRKYSSKLNKRIKTVLIPYILWNIIYLIVIGIVEILFPSFRSGETKLISHYNVVDYIYSLWDTNLINNIPGTGEPICFQFWFLRD